MPRLTSKGQVTVPKATREALGIGPGSEVEFVVRGNEAVLRKASIRAAIQRWRGSLRDGKGTDEIIEELRGPALE
jgi:AbrB family looped-hinge helix DNA binding protein